MCMLFIRQVWLAWLLLQASVCVMHYGWQPWWAFWALRQFVLWVLEGAWRDRRRDGASAALTATTYAALWVQQVVLPCAYWYAAVAATTPQAAQAA